MTWLLSSEAHRSAIAEIEQLNSDRAAAIVGAAIVETDLRNAIEARLQKVEQKFIDNFFGMDGPMGSFSVKINLGYLLGIYNDCHRKDLMNMAKIRNRFAHLGKSIDFQTDEIRDRCKNLSIVDDTNYPQVPGVGLPDEVRSPARLSPNAGSRERYIQACKLFLIHFWAASHDYVVRSGSHPRVWTSRLD